MYAMDVNEKLSALETKLSALELPDVFLVVFVSKPF
jgi:hypothetical protein